ncbi:MAG: SHOCT domain-containing protein [Bacteroidales bacterium]|nr:SHOCT domain-containing protein [Bacteroidales bacterium]
MIRIVYLIVVFILIVAMSYWIYKIISALKSDKKQKNKIQNINKNKSVVDELLQLQNLLEEGIITKKEFEKMKKQLID